MLCVTVRENRYIIIIHYNARSLLPKVDELRAVCVATKPNIICIVETWLDDSIPDNDLSYQLFRLDRNRHGVVLLFMSIVRC